jgi:ubiquinone/menaquinone biosynthesis C-methylase UbiE
MDEQRVATLYDQGPDRFYGLHYYRACDVPYAEEIARFTKGRRFRRILDLGCGSGRQMVMLAPHAEEIWGIDISAESLRQAEVRCARAGVSNMKFFHQSIVSSCRG